MNIKIVIHEEVADEDGILDFFVENNIKHEKNSEDELNIYFVDEKELSKLPPRSNFFSYLEDHFDLTFEFESNKLILEFFNKNS